jgi:hypothetical protein
VTQCIWKKEEKEEDDIKSKNVGAGVREGISFVPVSVSSIIVKSKMLSM